MIYLWNKVCDPHFFFFLKQIIIYYLSTEQVWRKFIQQKIFKLTSLTEKWYIYLAITYKISLWIEYSNGEIKIKIFQELSH